jgi:site-specific DNA recombinase
LFELGCFERSITDFPAQQRQIFCRGDRGEKVDRLRPAPAAHFKSTEEGLSQEFNSLDAQREAAEAYIHSQRGLGWKLVPTRYDDGGFSGGTLDRPALQQLLTDIDAGLVDCVVVYKVDRLSRSLLDFARIMERFERQNVSFVSITQQFNTTTSLGRLTMNVLLSLAHDLRPMK